MNFQVLLVTSYLQSAKDPKRVSM
ncbi:hypothetical protein EYZ11_007408 [Aspergillus tanneri]|uniref:Uncharacterized protein n=1 Tax=Aspergillus tanneri TaxID=1220188 RepID=A0A4S3JFE1_9EURO|nr:hypothetical protein EYZ11_007408 [Aspergillus tanneri]